MNKNNVKEIQVTCPICGQTNIVRLTEQQYKGYLAWLQGSVLIQDALPGLSADERELLKTHICNNCWNEMFNDEEEEQ